MLKVALLIFFTLLTANGLAQHRAGMYTLQGTINADSGSMWLCAVSSDTAFYPYQNLLKTNVVNGKFTFHDNIDYPTAYELILRKNNESVYISGKFFVDTGIQQVVCSAGSMKVTPPLDNAAMREWHGSYATLYAPIMREWDSLDNERKILRAQYNYHLPDSIVSRFDKREAAIADKRNEVLLRYASANPGSYIVLWKLVELLKYGYVPVYYAIYNKLSPTVKNTQTGRHVGEKLQSLSAMQPGMQFPVLHVYNSSLSKTTMFEKNIGKRYTLVDFWFTHCGPCRKQFPELRRLYAAYRDKGLEIVGVSVDEQKYIAEWKAMVKSEQLVWPQYWDKEMASATMLSVEGFPTNFLIDKDGKLIKKNVSLQELEALLSK